MAISVSFPFSWAAQPEARGPSCFLYSIISPSLWSPNSSDLQTRWPGIPRTPSAGCWLSLPHLVSNSLNFLCTELYNSSMSTQSLPITGHRNMHFRRLWNGMFDRHRAEITVMQFTGHPLLVHQFVTVPWDFNPVPYCHPSSPTPTEYRTSAVFGMACLAGSEVNILHSITHSHKDKGDNCLIWVTQLYHILYTY